MALYATILWNGDSSPASQLDVGVEHSPCY
jgi:hypothetical protein